jgi:hypothetical protein
MLEGLTISNGIGGSPDGMTVDAAAMSAMLRYRLPVPMLTKARPAPSSQPSSLWIGAIMPTVPGSS